MPLAKLENMVPPVKAATSDELDTYLGICEPTLNQRSFD